MHAHKHIHTHMNARKHTHTTTTHTHTQTHTHTHTHTHTTGAELLDEMVARDEERMEYGVETLDQQREKVKRMNLKKLSELQEEGKSIDIIIKKLKKDDDAEIKKELQQHDETER